MARVAILLTCYNHLAHLKEAVASIQAQTFQDYAVYALDDGSTDGTREWLTQFKEQNPEFPIVLVFNERNLGTYGNLNNGIAVSESELIAEFNDDDLWAHTKLEKQVAMLDERPEIGLVHTSGYFIGGKGERLEVNPLGFEWPKTGTGDVLIELIPHNKIIASSVLVRRTCFDEVGVFNTDYFGSGDWEMWYRIAEKFHIGHIDEPLTLYRVHEGSASHYTDKIAADDRRIREWMNPRLETYTDRGWTNEQVRNMLAHQYACLGTARTWTGDAKGGRQMYVRSLRVMPWRIKTFVRLIASFLPQKVFRALR